MTPPRPPGLALLLPLAFLSACPAPPTPPLECADGTVLSADGGACVAPLPPSTCPTGTRAAVGHTECVAVGWTACDAGFEPDPSGFGCRDVTPAAPCDAGTMPMLGSRSCQPVGWTSCPAGFAPHPSGWGCVDVSPPATCTGASRDALGQTACAPLGSCSAAFPPPAATLFVDDDLDGGQLDATHFNRIQAALDAAPAGATIAVETGTYAESLTATKAVTLSGRCAERVRVQGASTAPGLTVTAAGVAASGLTLSGHLVGAQIQTGGGLTLTDALVADNVKAGVVVSGKVGTVQSALTAVRTVVRGTRPDAAGTAYGLLVSGGATAALTESALVANPLCGGAVTGSGSALTLTRSIVRDDASTTNLQSSSLSAQSGGRLELTESAVIASKNTDVTAVDSATRVIAQRTVLRDPVGPAQYQVAFFVAQSTLEADAVALWNHDGVAVLGLDRPTALTVKNATIAITAGRVSPGGGFELDEPASLTVERTAVVNAGRASLLAVGAAKATVRDSLFLGTREGSDASGYMAAGVLANQGPTVLLDGVAIVGSQHEGVSASGEQTKLTITRGIVSDSYPGTQGGTPMGVIADDGATLELFDSLVANNASFGVALGAQTFGRPGVTPGRATIARTVVRDNHWDPTWSDAAGLFVQAGSYARVTDVAFVRNALAGVAAWAPGATVELERVVIRESVGGGDEFAYGVLAGDQAVVFLTDAVVREISGVGVLTHTRANATVAASLLDGFPDQEKARGIHSGFAAVAIDATVGVSGSTLQRAGAASVALEGSTGALRSCLVRGNTIALQAQGGSAVRQSAAVDDQPAPQELLVTGDTVFDGNVTLTGAGTVPLPVVPTF